MNNNPLSSRSAAAFLGLVLAALPLVSGCGPETPPYDELPLRDALRASPETLAELPEEARRDLAKRLAAEHASAEIEATPAHADVPTAVALVRGADEEREAEGRDAIVLGAIEPQGDGFVVQALALDKAAAATLDPSSLERSPEEATRLLEDAALRGQAGAVLAELARRADADDLVRVTGWPAGVIVADRTVFVNASWLVAMSALEPAEGAPAPALAPSWGPRGSWLVPQSIDANPYNLPPSIEVCASGVREKCECASSGQCAHEPADPTFADANAECTWVNLEPVNAEALCVLAIMSVYNVDECVEKGSGACTPVTDRQRALEFLADPTCREYLTSCLETGKPRDSGGSSGGPSGGSSGGSGSCNQGGCGSSSCGNSDCGGSDCGSCNSSSCGNSNCGSSSCGNSNCGSSGCGSKGCRISGQRSGAPPLEGEPWRDALLVLAPVAYVARRTRRRS